MNETPAPAPRQPEPAQPQLVGRTSPDDYAQLCEITENGRLCPLMGVHLGWYMREMRIHATCGVHRLRLEVGPNPNAWRWL